VESYYFDVYSYTLKYPSLPALDVGNKKKPTFIPIEVISIFPFISVCRSLLFTELCFFLGFIFMWFCIY
jgi:hypothetical protein